MQKKIDHHKVVIIGSGPAGYTAAIYTARAKLNPTVFTGLESGGQLMYTSELENFPGLSEGVIGAKFMMNLKKQAERFGTKVINKQVTAVDLSTKPFKVWTELPDGVAVDVIKKGNKDEVKEVSERIKKELPANHSTDSLIIATGATALTLGVKGEAKYFGQGVSTCAVCDAAFYRKKKVFVVGGGDCAMEDALALAKFTDQVVILYRRDKFRASKVMQKRVFDNKSIKIMWNSELKEVIGGDFVEKIVVSTDGSEKEHQADGVFLAIGHKPVTSIFVNQIELDQKGHIVNRVSLNKLGLNIAAKSLDTDGLINYPTMTSVDGVFAAGDVVDVRYKQAVTAAGMGCQAALDAEKWLEE